MGNPDLYRAKIDSSGHLLVDDGPPLLFPWWSFTKTVIATCALQLVAQGRLKIDDPIPGEPFTLRHLLQHRAGVPNYTELASYQRAVALGETPWSADEMLDRVNADQLEFISGESWSYSNSGYFLVRRRH